MPSFYFVVKCLEIILCSQFVLCDTFQTTDNSDSERLLLEIIAVIQWVRCPYKYF